MPSTRFFSIGQLAVFADEKSTFSFIFEQHLGFEMSDFFRCLDVLEMIHSGKIWHVVTVELSVPSKTLKSVFFCGQKGVTKNDFKSPRMV